jgi:hypothetical protein
MARMNRDITVGQDRTVMPSVASMLAGGDNLRGPAEAAISRQTATR